MTDQSKEIKSLLLRYQTANRGSIESLPGGGYRLSIPAGAAGEYRLAQLDDTQNRSRRNFSWQAPFTLELQARVSAADLPGTWGFGLWNDPFTASLGLGGGTRKLPALPQAAWFFHASDTNWLSLQDNIPHNGFLAATFFSHKISPIVFGLAAPVAPLLLWPVVSRQLRKLARRWIHGATAQLPVDPTQWHDYRLQWRSGSAAFQVDGQTVMETPVSPVGRLGLVIWIDNQYAAWNDRGRVAYGTQANPLPAWLEITAIRVMTKD